LTLGNFDLDFESSQVHLRTCLPLYGESLEPEMLQQLLLSHLQTADRHLVPFTNVLAGRQSPREAIAAL